MASIDWMPSYMLNLSYVLILITTRCRGYYFYGGGNSNLARPHTILKEKILQNRGHAFLFCCILFYICLLHPTLWNQISWTPFARWGSVNVCGATVSVFVCTGEAGQGCRPGCWLRKPWILLSQEGGNREMADTGLPIWGMFIFSS